MYYERPPQQPTCEEVSRIEHGGQILAREFLIERGGHTYFVDVSTESYLQTLDQHNAQHPEERIDYEYLLVEDLTDPEAICQFLHQLPLKDLEPFRADEEATDKATLQPRGNL